MAYKRISPQPVVEGGTGSQSLTGVLTGNGTSAITANAVTQHDVLIGGASNAVSFVANGTTGQYLGANTGADPSWQTPPTGVTGPGTTTDRAISTWNGTGGTALFNNSTTTISSGGILTMTAQPAMFAVRSTGGSNITGDGTISSAIAFDSVGFDQGSNYNSSTGVFTAPSAGIYSVDATVEFVSLGTATQYTIYIYLNGSPATAYTKSGVVTSGTSSTSVKNLLKLAVNDTLDVRIQATGTSKTVGFGGTSGGIQYTWFDVCKIC